MMQTFLNDLGAKYAFHLVVGGLRTKGEMQWDSASKAYLKAHWQQVNQKTGQEFSDSLFEKEFFTYDTHPACKAVVSVRELLGMQKAFEYLHLLQEAFYVDGLDITQEKNLTALAEKAGLERDVFETFFLSPRAQTLMEYDFAKARSMGANAFPSVVVIDKDGHMICQKGYRSITQMKQLLGEMNA